jgi:hypothetical protein
VIEPGTFGVVASPGFIPGAIRLTTRSPFSHAFVVVEGGMIVEAQKQGAIVSPLSKYSRAKDTALAFNDEEPLTDEQRDWDERLAALRAGLAGAANPEPAAAHLLTAHCAGLLPRRQD